ncbi:MAG: hypothetical protein ACO36A_05520 [Ilumatobacteraceae bacterium]
MTADQERRSRLLSLKLRALVRGHLGLDADPPSVVHPYGAGAALVTDDAVWVLAEGDDTRALGPALAWAMSRAPGLPLNLVTEGDGAVAARRAELFDADIHVWRAVERDLVAALPGPHAPVRSVDARHVGLMHLIEEAGAEVVLEHGVVSGEVRGLEMCRVVDDPHTGEARLEVGMGAHDREAFAMVHGQLPTLDALRQVIDAVLPHREDGAVPHPFNRFSAERLLRWYAVQDPRSVGCEALVPAEPPVPRTNLKDAVPCVAMGIDGDGNSVAVTFVVGVDLDAVPFALDAADRLRADRTVLAMRERDVTASVRALAGLAHMQPEIVTVRWPIAATP